MIVWHDLKKNSKDLPKVDGSYLCALKISGHIFYFVFRFNATGKDCFGKKKRKGFYDHDSEWGDIYRTDVVAWMEIPEFKENEDAE